MDAASTQCLRHSLDFEQRQLRRAEHDDIELVARCSIARDKGVDLGLPYGHCFGRRPGKGGVLSGDAGDVKHSHRAEAREPRAEMLQGVGAWDFGDTLDDRHLPIRAASLADDAADSPPFAEIAWRVG